MYTFSVRTPIRIYKIGQGSGSRCCEHTLHSSSTGSCLQKPTEPVKKFLSVAVQAVNATHGKTLQHRLTNAFCEEAGPSVVLLYTGSEDVF